MRRSLLQLFFDQLYTRLAWGYDGVAALVSGGQWYEWGAAALDYVELDPVLEGGCGRGRLLPRLAAAGGGGGGAPPPPPRGGAPPPRPPPPAPRAAALSLTQLPRPPRGAERSSGWPDAH